MGRLSSFLGALLALVALLPAACTDSSGYREPGPRPEIVEIAAPTTVNCAPECTGGACPMGRVGVTFRLPEEHFVKKAYLRFQRDGSEVGVDREYPLEPTFGAGAAGTAAVSFEPLVPPNLVGTGVLFTYSVRLLTGLGDESDESTLTLTVTNTGNEDCRKRNQGEPLPSGSSDAGAAP